MKHDAITNELIEDERYELAEAPVYDFSHTRRAFVEAVGAGIVIAIGAADSLGQLPSLRTRGGNTRTNIADRIHIAEDGTVTVWTGKVEVGQGSRTQVCQAAAEELRVPLQSVRAVMGDTELCPNDGGTSGSGTTPRTIPSIRTAAAAARKLLLELAAEKLGAQPDALELRDGRISQPGSGRAVSYAELAKDKSLAEKLDAAPPRELKLEPVDNWRVLGQPAPRAEAEQIVMGAHRYPSDIVRPQMLYGRVLRKPAYGATLVSIDVSKAEAMPAVKVVRDGDFVGCAASSSWAAAKAVEALEKSAKWQLPDGEQPSSDTLSSYLKEHESTSGGGRGGRGGTSRGTADTALEAADKKLSAAFDIAYVQHAPMEPRAAVAEWQDGKLTVWTATQNPLRVRGELMEAFKLPADRARVIVPDAGGGFGGKHTGEVALEAARLAKGSGKPVSLRWTRAEEFTWAYFRPAGLIEASAALDANGRLSAWKFVNYNSGGSALETPYQVPNVRTQFISSAAPLRAGSYRALASTANTFARECFMDELARAAGADPLRFRLDHLPAGRLRDVLTAAAEKFDWPRRSAKRQPNTGVGLACGTEKGSFVAACAEITVDRASGAIRVLHVCEAFECGAIQNPANLRAQVEGSILMGLGAALRERVRFAEGKIANASFSEYLVPRMDDLPELDTVLLNRRDLPSAGAGETPIIAIAPAIANAVFQATGVRVRSMPISAELLKLPAETAGT
ncbi:MAG TPA: molybdopterin cofactor-binding domain-containing protein [Pirellulales bacterium]|jgi:CO/xanthine dehydrogenase Mo-binding subunit|nr:molybdopterin cofactor-binding domain-containing protein [Pirellulales bacterium]